MFQKYHQRRPRMWKLIVILSALITAYIVIRHSHQTTDSHHVNVNSDRRHETTTTSPPIILPHVSANVNRIHREFPQYSGLYKLPWNVTHVHCDNTDVDTKILHYNTALSEARGRILSGVRQPTQQRSVAGRSLQNHWQLIAGNGETYLHNLSRLEQTETIVLDWTDTALNDSEWTSFEDTSNLLVQEYYPWVGSHRLCGFIQSESFTRHNYDTVFNRQCSTDVSVVKTPASMELFILNAIQIHVEYYLPNGGRRYPERFYTDLPQLMTYVHVIKSGVITPEGEVFVAGHKIVPYTCKPKFNHRSQSMDLSKAVHHKEIFTISQFWSSGFFHKTLESLPRIAPYLQFLRENRDIRIHVADAGSTTSALMSLLGLASSRLVTGVVSADIAYLPRGTSCGYPQVTETQLLSKRLRASLHAPDKVSSKTLLLIRRSRMRFFIHNAEIASGLEQLAAEFGLEFFLFKDNPLPSLNETILAFNRAAMVVAPHGAGLSNLLFSQPGTYVIEGLCNPPHTNMCYTRTAYILGLRYHALISQAGCEGRIDIPAREVTGTARDYLSMMKDSGFI